MQSIRPILRGLKTYVPFQPTWIGTGGSDSARYCYSVWMRHLSVALANGLERYPETIAELGPGDSIGIGLAGLIGGARRYYALDVVEHATNKRNRRNFDELVQLFRDRADIPGEKEHPGVYPRLDSYRFRRDIFTPEVIEAALDKTRLSRIRRDLHGLGDPRDESSVRYICPWFDPDIIVDQSVDFIYSQAVLEHVEDLEHTYASLYRWLKTGGTISHQIDFKCHGMTEKWNGHWSYNEFLWKLIKGNRPFLLNREPLSTHLAHLEAAGFEVVHVIPVLDTGGLGREQLAPRYRDLTDEDLLTCSAHIIARKP